MEISEGIKEAKVDEISGLCNQKHKMSELEQLNILHFNSELDIYSEIISKQETEEKKLNGKYNDMNKELKKELEKLNDVLEEIIAKNNAISEKLGEKDTVTENDFINNDFFHKMNAYDNYEAKLKGTEKGLKCVLRRLREEINKQEVVIKKLESKVNDLISTLPGGYLEDESLNGIQHKVAYYKPTSNKEIQKLFRKVGDKRIAIGHQNDRINSLISQIDQKKEISKFIVDKLGGSSEIDDIKSFEDLIQEKRNLIDSFSSQLDNEGNEPNFTKVSKIISKEISLVESLNENLCFKFESDKVKKLRDIIINEERSMRNFLENIKGYDNDDFRQLSELIGRELSMFQDFHNKIPKANSISPEDCELISYFVEMDHITGASYSQLIKEQKMYKELLKEKKDELNHLKDLLSERESPQKRQQNVNNKKNFGKSPSTNNNESTEHPHNFYKWTKIRNDFIESKNNNVDVSESDNWKNERDLLLSKIKLLRNKAKNLRKVVSNNTNIEPRSNTLSDIKKFSKTLTNKEIFTTSSKYIKHKNNNENSGYFLRKALCYDLEMFSTGSHPIRTAIQAEEIYSEKLDNEIKYLEKILADIESHKKEVYSDRFYADIVKNNELKISLLNEELNDLRKKFSQVLNK